MNESQLKALVNYDREYIGKSKGALSFALVITRTLQSATFPVSPDAFRTPQEGQVKGLGGGAVKKVLKDHGITRLLSSEGGRTSRGSMGKLRPYLTLLNDLHSKGQLDLKAAEKFWVQRTQEYFDQLPFTFRLDPNKSLRSCVRHLLTQALQRQRENTGTMYVGAVMQHLIGAKLDHIVDGAVEHHGFSVADAPTNRSADFLVGDTAIHVTTAPSDGLMRKLQDNLESGLRPLIVTTEDGLGGAKALSKNVGIDERIDVIEIEQFIAGNLYEWSKFRQADRIDTTSSLFRRYNEIIEETESDPSLRVDLGDDE